MTQSMTKTSSSDLRAQLDLIELKPGLKFSRAVLCELLPTVETTLFFGKVYDLDVQQLGTLLQTTVQSDVVTALLSEGGTHSSDLQDYVVDMLDQLGTVDEGDITFDPDVPKGEVLPEMWKSLEVEVAASIKQVANKLQSAVHALPGKQGAMVFRSMMVMNQKRPTLGDHRAAIHHAPQKKNLMILAVSGSMTESTIRRIIEDVVAMAYMANADMAIVSNTCSYWEAGTYDVDTVLARAEYGGTHYEELAPLFDRQDWGTVICVADYDSSWSAKQVLAQQSGHIDEVVDISLTCRPTFLAECVGQLADSVRPILVANTMSQDYILRS